jgi:hypothetical protein
MAAETPRAAKGKSGSIKAGRSRASQTAHATPKHAARAEGTKPRPTRVATSVKKRA